MKIRRLVGTSSSEWGPEWTFSRNGRVEHCLDVLLHSMSPMAEPGGVRFGFHAEISGHLVDLRNKPIVTGVGTARAYKDGVCLVTILIGPEVIDLDPEDFRRLLSSLWREGAFKMAARAAARFPEHRETAEMMVRVVGEVLEKWLELPLSEIDVDAVPKWVEDVGRPDLFDASSNG